MRNLTKKFTFYLVLVKNMVMIGKSCLGNYIQCLNIQINDTGSCGPLADTLSIIFHTNKKCPNAYLLNFSDNTSVNRMD